MLGARVVIPAVCIFTSAALFMLSFVSTTFAVVFVVQLVGFLAATACVPALRAGLSDAAPAHLRGTGFGAFNLASVVFGAAAAPIITSAVAEQFGNNFRTAFLILMPIAFLGAACLMLARRHIEVDAAKVFEAMRPLTSADLVRGQYAGYRKEPDVAKNSDVETFCAVKLFRIHRKYIAIRAPMDEQEWH